MLLLIKLILVLLACNRSAAYQSLSWGRISGGAKRLSPTQLQSSILCRAWMVKTESKIKNIPIKDTTSYKCSIQKAVNKRALCLTETSETGTFFSILDFLPNGEIVFRSSEVPQLHSAKGFWTVSSDSGVLKMVIDRAFCDGTKAKAHYMGVANQNGEDDSMFVGGEVCDESCQVENVVKGHFELTLMGDNLLPDFDEDVKQIISERVSS